MEHMQENAELLIQHRAIATVVGNAFMLDVGAVLPETASALLIAELVLLEYFRTVFTSAAH